MDPNNQGVLQATTDQADFSTHHRALCILGQKISKTEMFYITAHSIVRITCVVLD